MTAPQLMDYFAARIQAALPGWQVFPYPLPETAIAGPVVELGMGSSAIADWRLSGPGLQETLLIALSAPVKPHPAPTGPSWTPGTRWSGFSTPNGATSSTRGWSLARRGRGWAPWKPPSL